MQLLRLRMLQSHICVSPGLPPSPPPLPSPMPKEEIVLVKYGACNASPPTADFKQAGGSHTERQHLLTRLEIQVQGGDPETPMTCHSMQGGCQLSWHHTATATTR